MTARARMRFPAGILMELLLRRARVKLSRANEGVKTPYSPLWHYADTREFIR